MLVIKPERETIYIIVCLFGISFLFLLISCITGMSVLGIPISIICGFVALRYWMVLGRTIVLDESGCYVKFLWYERFYKWNELKVKREEKYPQVFSYRFPYTKGIVFSPYSIHRPKWLGPVEYGILLQPISFVFLFFASERNTNLSFFGIYEVEEVNLKEKLRMWNVDLN